MTGLQPLEEALTADDGGARLADAVVSQFNVDGYNRTLKNLSDALARRGSPSVPHVLDALVIIDAQKSNGGPRKLAGSLGVLLNSLRRCLEHKTVTVSVDNASASFDRLVASASSIVVLQLADILCPPISTPPSSTLIDHIRALLSSGQAKDAVRYVLRFDLRDAFPLPDIILPLIENGNLQTAFNYVRDLPPDILRACYDLVDAAVEARLPTWLRAQPLCGAVTSSPTESDVRACTRSDPSTNTSSSARAISKAFVRVLDNNDVDGDVSLDAFPSICKCVDTAALAWLAGSRSSAAIATFPNDPDFGNSRAF